MMLSMIRTYTAVFGSLVLLTTWLQICCDDRLPVVVNTWPFVDANEKGRQDPAVIPMFDNSHQNNSVNFFNQ